MPFCTQCGHQNPDDARFCSQCGSPLRHGLAAGQPAVERPAVERPGEVTSTISLSGVDFDGPPPGESAVAELPVQDRAAVEALPPGSALLVVLRGPNAGSRFLLDAEVTSAGRHTDSDIFLDDVTVSRRHAEFVRTPDGFLVRDVGSLNGTYVNRDRIDEARLHNGDEVQIGKYRLVFHTGVGAGSAGPRIEQVGRDGTW